MPPAIKDPLQPTEVLVETWDVDRRLQQLKLDRRKLLDVVAVALAERSNATAFHCANAAGTFAYQHGTFALRAQFAPDGWIPDRLDGVETIRLDGIKVAFSNVDLACDRYNLPRPRSEKGAGAERAALGNLFGTLALPHYAPRSKDGHALFYLMVGEDGRAELTQAVVRDGVFVAAIERIFLGSPDDLDDRLLRAGSDHDIDGFDPVVERKKTA